MNWLYHDRISCLLLYCGVCLYACLECLWCLSFILFGARFLMCVVCVYFVQHWTSRGAILWLHFEAGVLLPWPHSWWKPCPCSLWGFEPRQHPSWNQHTSVGSKYLNPRCPRRGDFVRVWTGVYHVQQGWQGLRMARGRLSPPPRSLLLWSWSWVSIWPTPCWSSHGRLHQGINSCISTVTTLLRFTLVFFVRCQVGG